VGAEIPGRILNQRRGDETGIFFKKRQRKGIYKRENRLEHLIRLRRKGPWFLVRRRRKVQEGEQENEALI
jgi:hypothetical protein